LPLTLIALRDNKPIGMCSLRVNDGIRPDLSPWLGSLFVDPSARGLGVGKLLINAVIEKAHNMGFSNLYLLTFDDTLPKWYEKLGWKLIVKDELNGYPVSVMKFSL
jgi:GNAT superfamily N-acetyltransferase